MKAVKLFFTLPEITFIEHADEHYITFLIQKKPNMTIEINLSINKPLQHPRMQPIYFYFIYMIIFVLFAVAFFFFAWIFFNCPVLGFL